MTQELRVPQGILQIDWIGNINTCTFLDLLQRERFIEFQGENLIENPCLSIKTTFHLFNGQVKDKNYL